MMDNIDEEIEGSLAHQVAALNVIDTLRRSNRLPLPNASSLLYGFCTLASSTSAK
jgi:hypothetical protein